MKENAMKTSKKTYLILVLSGVLILPGLALAADEESLWDKAKEATSKGWEDTKKGTEAAAEWSKEKSVDAWDATKEGASEAADWTKEKADKAWQATREGTESAMDALKGEGDESAEEVHRDSQSY